MVAGSNVLGPLLVVALLGILLWHWRGMRLQSLSRQARIIGMISALLWAGAIVFGIFTKPWGSPSPHFTIWFVAFQLLLLIFLVPRHKITIPLICLGLSIGLIYFMLYLTDVGPLAPTGWEASLLAVAFRAPIVLLLVCFYYIVRFGLAGHAGEKHADIRRDETHRC